MLFISNWFAVMNVLFVHLVSEHLQVTLVWLLQERGFNNIR
jgi:hypothetical protein